MVWLRCLAAGIAVQLASAPATATQVTPSSGDTIDVLGQAPAGIRDEVQDYVRQLGVVLGERPASRWVDSICLSAVGLRPAEKALVEQQVRGLAASVGAPLAGAACEPNLVIAFTDSASDLVQQISGRGSLGTVSYEERQELERSSAPIRWWYTTETRAEDGSAPLDVSPLGVMFRGHGNYDRGARGGQGGNLGIRDATLVSTRTMRAIRHATVVIDVNRASGKGLRSVIDYAALVALAEIRPGATPPNSVLSLFAPGGAKRLMPKDRALLKGLYELQLPRKADHHRRVLISSIIEDEGNR